MSSELSQVIVKMNGEINQIMERNLSPHFETIRIIESLLKQLPEFKRLEQENADLKKRLSLCMELYNLEMNNQADLELSNQEVQNDMQQTVSTTLAPASIVPATLVPIVKNEIKLEIVETPSSLHPIVSEDELYKTVNLSNHVDNKLQTVAEEEEVEESEAEEETSEEEEETSEADEVEESEEEVEESEEEVEEEEAESGGEGENPPEEEEEEEEEEEVEEESGGEGLAELADSPEEGGVGENPPEEEVFIITIKGKGNFYTSNETNGDIYAIEGEDDVGDIVGKFVNKVATFN